MPDELGARSPSMSKGRGGLLRIPSGRLEPPRQMPEIMLRVTAVTTCLMSQARARGK